MPVNQNEESLIVRILSNNLLKNKLCDSNTLAFTNHRVLITLPIMIYAASLGQ